MTRGVDEPYRMFHSTALSIFSPPQRQRRPRLTELGRSIGLVDDVRWKTFERRRAQIDGLTSYLRAERSEGVTLETILRRPPTTWDELLALRPGLADLADDPSAIEQVTIGHCGGYIARQGNRSSDSAGSKISRSRSTPPRITQAIPAPRRGKHREVRAASSRGSLGQAGRISGVNPSDIATLLIHLKRPRPAAPAAPSGATS